MNRVIGFLAMIAVVMASSGAVSAKEAKVPPGYVVASFWDGIGVPQSLTVTQLATGKKYYVAARGLSSYRPTDEAGAYSGVAVQKLPPGRYVASHIEIYSASLTAKIDFSYPFTVGSGMATYIGEYHPFQIEGKGILFSRPVAVKYSISDQLDRDRPLALAKLPSDTPFLDQAPPQRMPLEILN